MATEQTLIREIIRANMHPLYIMAYLWRAYITGLMKGLGDGQS